MDCRLQCKSDRCEKEHLLDEKEYSECNGSLANRPVKPCIRYDKEKNKKTEYYECVYGRPVRVLAEFSTLIGRGPTRLCSHWLDLDHSDPMQALLCHKDTAQGSQIPLLLGAFLVFSCVFMA